MKGGNKHQAPRFVDAGLPATTSMIPPSIDSLILDYQSPNALPGYYPNEQSLTGNQGGIGRAILPSTLYLDLITNHLSASEFLIHLQM